MFSEKHFMTKLWASITKSIPKGYGTVNCQSRLGQCDSLTMEIDQIKEKQLGTVQSDEPSSEKRPV